MFEPKAFRKQIYCIEESTCDIVNVGTFRCPSQSFGAPIVIRRPRNRGLLAPLVTPVIPLHQWRSWSKMFRRAKNLTLCELQYFVWDTASQSTKWVDMLNIFGGNCPLGIPLATPTHCTTQPTRAFSAYSSFLILILISNWLPATSEVVPHIWGWRHFILQRLKRRVILKAYKTGLAAWPASRSALMGVCKGTVHTRRCRWLATSAALWKRPCAPRRK